MAWGSSFQRLRNGVAKVAAGLTPFGESVWPGVRNDLFVAHESIYRFFSTFAEGQRILDAGCGAGYGALALARAGARSVLAVDIDRRSVAFGRRHFSHPAVRFEVADLNAVKIPVGSFDLVVSSNVLEHLTDPAGFVAEAHRALPAGGRAVLAVPPITSPTVLDDHRDIHFHRSNLTVDQWLRLVESPGWRAIDIVAHRYRESPVPDFTSPFTS
ncbi:MAG TPA: class I SAM-dependent methyltransferase, partial [Thermoanaerobaculia bacterium]|nr:class I SAM-dependent methyltransferase [Thermoanaerobaculia bacterium]